MKICEWRSVNGDLNDISHSLRLTLTVSEIDAAEYFFFFGGSGALYICLITFYLAAAVCCACYTSCYPSLHIWQEMPNRRAIWRFSDSLPTHANSLPSHGDAAQGLTPCIPRVPSTAKTCHCCILEQTHIFSTHFFSHILRVNVKDWKYEWV